MTRASRAILPGPEKSLGKCRGESQSVAFLDCEVRDRMEVGNHTFFAGEVVDCDFLKPEDTPILSMSDTRMNYGG